VRSRYEYAPSPIENARPGLLFILESSVKQMVGFWYLNTISWIGARKLGALVDFLGNFVRSRFMFGLGIAHGGIAGMIIAKQWNLNFSFSW